MLNKIISNQTFTINLLIAFRNLNQSNRWISCCGNLNFAISQLYFSKSLFYKTLRGGHHQSVNSALLKTEPKNITGLVFSRKSQIAAVSIGTFNEVTKIGFVRLLKGIQFQGKITNFWKAILIA